SVAPQPAPTARLTARARLPASHAPPRTGAAPPGPVRSQARRAGRPADARTGATPHHDGQRARTDASAGNAPPRATAPQRSAGRPRSSRRGDRHAPRAAPPPPRGSPGTRAGAHLAERSATPRSGRLAADHRDIGQSPPNTPPDRRPGE